MKVALYDKHCIIREGIKSILKELKNYVVVAEFEEISEIELTLSKIKIDILIGDFASEKEINLLQHNEKHFPELSVLVISNEISEDLLFRILELNTIKGIHLKDSRKVDLITAITIIANREKSFCPQIIDILQRMTSQKNTANIKSVQKLKNLTVREAEIVKLVAEGKTAKEIAQKLLISIHTVNTYRKNILKKLGVKNSSELVLYAIKNNIIDSTEYFI